MENTIEKTVASKPALDPLFKALSKCQGEIDKAYKSGSNTYDHYRYTTLPDYIKSIKEPMQKNGLSITFSQEELIDLDPRVTSGGKNEYVVRVKMCASLHHESGSSIDMYGWGEGQDRGDKAIYKAITGAKKYILANVFNIPTTDDPEKDSHEDAENTGKPVTGTPVKQASKTPPNSHGTPPTVPPKAHFQPPKQIPAMTVPVIDAGKKKFPTAEEQAAKGLISPDDVVALQGLRNMHKIPDDKWKSWLFVKGECTSAWLIPISKLAEIEYTLANNPLEIITYGSEPK